MPVQGEFFQNPGSGGGGFYDHQINHSVRFEEDASDKIARTPSSSGNQRTFTVSFWLKRTVITHSGNHMVIFGADVGASSNYWQLRLNNTDGFQIAANGGTEYIYDPLLRDTSAWGHYMVAYDNTQSTSTDRVKFYINGTQITDTSYATAPSQNFDTAMNQSGVEQHLGILRYASSTSDFAGYIAEFVIIDGTAQAPTDLGESKNGVWIPKDPSGLTFGTNGVYLKFENASDLGNDSSGNNNDFTATNMPADRQVIDSPTIGTG